MSAAHTAPQGAGPLLEVEDLGIELWTDGGWVPAVDGVSFTVPRGRHLGIVGESGSGKTLTALSLMRLLPDRVRLARGRIVLDGLDLVSASPKQMGAIRGADVAMVFQEPMTSLNPAFTVGDQVAEVLRRHRGASRRQARARAVEALGRVEMPDPARQARSYPHELSGGMRQRAMIAMAIACSPRLLIADEPTTALDATIQAEIIELLTRMGEELDLSIIIVSHDFGVISEVADDVMVMYAGQAVETGAALDLFSRPRHPYLAALLEAQPAIGRDVHEPLPFIAGGPPQPGAFPAGCRFRARCDFAVAACEEPVALTVDERGSVRCVRHHELRLEVAQ